MTNGSNDATTIGSAARQANVINWNTIILAVISLLTTIVTSVGAVFLALSAWVQGTGEEDAAKNSEPLPAPEPVAADNLLRVVPVPPS